MRTELSEQALILAPMGRDAHVAASMLRETGICGTICPSIADLVRCLEEGAGFALVTEEALLGIDLRPLRNWILAQPEWSDFPFVLLTARGGGLERNPSASRHLETLGNVTFLERPFHPTTLVSLAQAALRGRRRQYDARARLLALQEGEERYRQIVEGAEDFAIVKLDAEGVLTSWNSGAVRITGFSVEEAIGRYGDFFFTPEDIAAAQPEKELARSLKQGRAVNERWHQCKDGSRFWGSGLSMSLDSGGFLKIFRDATAEHQSQAAIRELNETLEARVAARTVELGQAQEALRQSQKMEAMGQLTGGVAHDFNNLLTPIVGSLDLLQRRGIGTAREQRMIEGALQSAERARILVQRLLAFARRQPLRATGVDLEVLVEGMVDLVARASGPRVNVALEVEPNLPAVQTDPNQLEMAILNLAVNARDAMENGGTLTITADVDEVRGRSDLSTGRYVRLRVTDTGSGMDEATRARAIEPFFSTKGIGKGTGLGLSMVHGLAAQLGGSLSIDSSRGVGTTVILWLPIAAEGAEPDKPTAPRQIGSGGGTALLVDDEELARMSTADMLEDIGYSVVETDSAEGALRLLKEGLRPDVLITDHLMPGMTGTELARSLSKLDLDLPVLVISGFAEVDEIAADLPRLTKPFRQHDLAECVSELFAVKA